MSQYYTNASPWKRHDGGGTERAERGREGGAHLHLAGQLLWQVVLKAVVYDTLDSISRAAAAAALLQLLRPLRLRAPGAGAPRSGGRAAGLGLLRLALWLRGAPRAPRRRGGLGDVLLLRGASALTCAPVILRTRYQSRGFQQSWLVSLRTSQLSSLSSRLKTRTYKRAQTHAHTHTHTLTRGARSTLSKPQPLRPLTCCRAGPVRPGNLRGRLRPVLCGRQRRQPPCGLQRH
jgi:hypothetical protein